jgi:hypothetical protein
VAKNAIFAASETSGQKITEKTAAKTKNIAATGKKLERFAISNEPHFNRHCTESTSGTSAGFEAGLTFELSSSYVPAFGRTWGGHCRWLKAS